jgi:uncharacterized membrane protein YgcG
MAKPAIIFWKAPLLAQVDTGVFSFMHTMRGPEFLVFYGIWFFIVFVAVWIARKCDRDTPLITVAGLCAFELPGIVRIIIGSQHGMHRWWFLVILMILGFIAFLLRAEHFDGLGSGNCNSSCSSSSSSSCSSGGGGCGGGGGGGCGGCGGS